MAPEESSEAIKYQIKVPVYSSAIKNDSNLLFGGISYTDMINHIKSKIDSYEETPFDISRKRRNKAETRKIDTVIYNEFDVGETPSLLINFSAFNTDLHDGFVEIEEKINLEQNHKIGSDTNYFLLYPRILGIDGNNLKYQWLILIYEDPNKDNYELASSVKLLLKKLLDIKTANIKIEQVLSEIQRMKAVPELQLRFNSLNEDDNAVDTKYRPYLVKSKLKRLKEDKFENLPVADTTEIINNTEYESDYQSREIRIKEGNREFRLKRMLEDASEVITQTVEEIFNYSIEIREMELETVYDEQIIKSRLVNVLNEYIVGSDE